ncbi:hhe domain protein [Colletotrichum truncatum]|uniref:Hhe domain protein n=1 Tax=Colletotrichum truncatum TaxID=5467 RepID=A0ACC3YF12_COLTU|nr:hhe domain protein [Colletotrichum truncatum]KAF6784989.1 hhe domain protein [Colletotrichum truncatum]
MFRLTSAVPTLSRTVRVSSVRPVTASPWVRRQFHATPFIMGRVSDAIKEDHRELEAYYQRIIDSTDLDAQTRFQNLFVWELARHSISEELVIYPALEKEVSGGKALADKDRSEHQTVKEKLYKFQKLKSSDPDFLPTIESLMKDLKEHIKEEEEEDLVKLEKAIDNDKSEALATSFERTKMFTPTKSHPAAPNKPPFETVAGLMAAPLDKLVDMFSAFPSQQEKSDAKR